MQFNDRSDRYFELQAAKKRIKKGISRMLLKFGFNDRSRTKCRSCLRRFFSLFLCIISVFVFSSCLNRQNSEPAAGSESVSETTGRVIIHIDPAFDIWFCYQETYAIIELTEITEEKEHLPPYIGADKKEEQDFVKVRSKLLASSFSSKDPTSMLVQLPDKNSVFEMYINHNMSNEVKAGDVILVKLSNTRKDPADYYTLAVTETRYPDETSETTAYIPFVDGKAVFSEELWTTYAFQDFNRYINENIDRINRLRDLDYTDSIYSIFLPAYQAAPDCKFENGITLEDAIIYFEKLELSTKLYEEAFAEFKSLYS